MNSALIPVLLGGLMTIFFVFIFWLAANQSEQAWQRVQQLAEKLGLTMEPAKITVGKFRGAPRASGEIRGKRVEIYAYATGSGKSRTRWSALSAQPRADGGLTFSLTRQGFGTKVLEFFGTKEIQIGDPTFDAAWFIQTNQPEFFVAALLPEFRAKLDAVTRGGMRGSFKLEHGKVVYAEMGHFNEACCARLERVAEVACDLGDIAEVFAESKGR